MRGGTSCDSGPQSTMMGLSPHARGNRYAGDCSELRVGPIPACAGEPKWDKSQAIAIRAYPRMRGGTTPAQVSGAANFGLSPHARGNHHNLTDVALHHGPIPACAGEPGRQCHSQF